MGVGVVPTWLDLHEWAEHWNRREWLQMLADESGDTLTRVELQEASMSGHPLGQLLVERLEKELGRRLHRGMMGRPAK